MQGIMIPSTTGTEQYEMTNATLLTEYKKETYKPYTMIDYDDLNKYPGLVITGHGEENIHFTHKGKKYSCKCL